MWEKSDEPTGQLPAGANTNSLFNFNYLQMFPHHLKIILDAFNIVKICIGENIPLLVNITNLSPRRVRFMVIISRKAIFHDRYNLETYDITSMVVSVSHSVGARRTVVWDTHIHIPITIPNTTQTKCINVKYYLNVNAKVA